MRAHDPADRALDDIRKRQAITQANGELGGPRACREVLHGDLDGPRASALGREIGEPDEELLSQVIVKLFADRQLYIDDKLVLYIVNRMERSLNAAQLIVDRLDRLALGRGTRITRLLAAEVLNELGSSDQPG